MVNKIIKRKNVFKYLKDDILDVEYEVYGIVTFNRKEHYILIINDYVTYVESNLVTITDNTISNKWSYFYFPKKHTIRSWHDALGNDYISIEKFIGPKCFIDDDLFLLNIRENKNEANRFMYTYIKNYGANDDGVNPNLKLL